MILTPITAQPTPKAKQPDNGLLLQLAAQIERALDGKWNGGKTPKVHVAKA